MDRWIKQNKITVGIFLALVIVLSAVSIALLKHGVEIQPTVTEIFRLRSDCASFGQKILDKTDKASGLAQSQVSHYNSATNRCYVLLKSTFTDSYSTDFREYLYDGQTEELLAYGEDQTGKGATHFGEIGNDPTKITPTSSKTAFDIVDEYINGIMTDNPKQ